MREMDELSEKPSRYVRMPDNKLIRFDHDADDELIGAVVNNYISQNFKPNAAEQIGTSLADASLGLLEGTLRTPESGVQVGTGISNKLTGAKGGLLPRTDSYLGDLLLNTATGGPLGAVGSASRSAGDVIDQLRKGLRDTGSDTIDEAFLKSDLENQKNSNALAETNIPAAIGKTTGGDFKDALSLLQEGNYDKIKDMSATDAAGFAAAALPSLATGIFSKGRLSAPFINEGGSTASNIAEFEKEKGRQVSPEDYAKSYGRAALINSILERVGLDKVAKGKGGFLGSVLGEASTETLQQVNSNLADRYYNKDKDLSEGVLESLIGGGLSGGGMHAVHSRLPVKKNGEVEGEITEDLNLNQELGVTPKDAVESTSVTPQSIAIDDQGVPEAAPIDPSSPIDSSSPTDPSSPEGILERFNSSDPTLKSEELRNAIAEEKLEFRDGKLSVVGEAPAESEPLTPQQVADALNNPKTGSGSNITSEQLRNMLADKTLSFANGKLVATTPEPALPELSTPQQVVEALNNPKLDASKSVSLDQLRGMLADGSIKSVNGKLVVSNADQELAPKTIINPYVAALQGDYKSADRNVVADLVKRGDLEYNGNQLQTTEQGKNLLADMSTYKVATPQEMDELRNFKGEPSGKSFRESLESTNIPISEMQNVNPQTGGKLPVSDPRATINAGKLAQAANAPQSAPVEQAPEVLEAATPQEDQEIDEYHESKDDIPFSVTPTTRFSQATPELKKKVQAIAARINPTVAVNFADNIFGEGERLKDSGAQTSDKQEVGGTFSRLKNLMEVSLNTKKFDPLNTAFHEAWHSIEQMLTKDDLEVLNKNFPGNDKYSAQEQRAIAFAEWAQSQNIESLPDAVKRVFSKIMQFLKDIGRTLKLGKFNSIDDIFSRAESGKTYKQYNSKLKQAIANGDIAAIKSMDINQAALKQAVKEVSQSLYDITYSPSPASDLANLADMIAETPEDAVYSIGNRVFSKIKPDKEKILGTFLKVTSPIVTKSVADTAMQHLAMNLKNTTTAIKKPSDIGGGQLLARSLVQSLDGTLRFVAAKAKSPTISQIADYFYHGAGIAGSVGATYHEAVGDYISRNMNALAKVVNGLTEKELSQIVDILQNPDDTHRTSKQVKDASIVIGKMILDQREYLKAAGLPIAREVKGYFQRFYDEDTIAGDPAGFVEKATEAYIKTFPQLSKDEATDRAEKWLDNVLKKNQMGHDVHDNDFNIMSDMPSLPDESKARVFIKEADEILKDYMVRNPVDVMSMSLRRAARAAEFNKRFGPEQWKVLKAAMREEGVGEEATRQVLEAIRINTGMIQQPKGAVHTTLGNMRYYGSLITLMNAGITSLPEGFTVATKTGNVVQGLSNMINGWRNIPELKDRAEAYGLLGEVAEQMMMSQRTGGDYQRNELNYKSKQFFNRTLTAPITERQIAATTRVGQWAIGKWTGNRSKANDFMLKELGVPSEKIKEFSEWVNDNGGKELQDEFGLGNSEMATMYRTALRRFVYSTIQVPTAATRQKYSHTPFGQFVYGLTSYIQAFSKNVLIRNARLAKEAVSIKKGYTMRDRWEFASQSMMLLPLLLLAGGLRDLRDELNPYSREKEAQTRLLDYAQAGNIFGAADPFISMIRGMAYGKSPGSTVLGPVNSKIADAIKDFGNFVGNNSEDTNSSERSVAKQVYTLGIAPWLTSLIATNSPYSIPATLAILAINNPAVKGKIIDKAAGEKQD